MQRSRHAELSLLFYLVCLSPKAEEGLGGAVVRRSWLGQMQRGHSLRALGGSPANDTVSRAGPLQKERTWAASLPELLTY